MSTESSLAEYHTRIGKVLDYINAHMAEDLPLETLADAACFSSFHFHRIFSSMTGETPAGYVNRLRLERSANLLITSPSVSITEIALACGFSSSATFSRSFKKHFGIPASQVRDESKKCKTESKIGKARGSITPYIEDGHTHRQQSRERSASMNVTITQLPPYHIVYAASLKGYVQEHIDAVWRKICGWAGPHPWFGRETKMIGIGFDNPNITPKEKCRYYACLTVPSEVHPPSGFGVMDLPGGTYAVKHFEGKTAQLADAYGELYGHWLPKSGYQPANSPCYEVYTSLPEHSDTGNFVIEICLPIIPF